MKKAILAVGMALMCAGGAAVAQSESSDIRESTDPARIADVERRAAEIQANQQSTAQSSGASGASEADKPRRKMKSEKSRMHRDKTSGARGSAASGGDSGSK